jgi:hypothetical protein
VGIQCHIRAIKPGQINFFTDDAFYSLRKLVDALYRKLHSQGIGCSDRKSEILTDIDEDKLWNAGVLNPDTPQGLLNCVFFLKGKNFCLRGGAEHRNLKISQLKREIMKLTGQSHIRYMYVLTQSTFRRTEEED